MTRKDYQAIADVIHSERDKVAEWDTEYELGAGAALNQLAISMADKLRVEGGFDTNGNRRFKTDKFLQACGFDSLSAKAIANERS